MSDQQHSLSKPASIPDSVPAQEFVRFWIANNTDHASVFVGSAGDPEKEAPMWGFILADIAKHVTRTMRQQNPDGPAAQEIMEHILGGIGERLKHAPELSGKTVKVED